MLSFPRATCLALLVAAPLQAQTTYRVDGRGGGDFVDLRKAIATVRAGDILLVADGTYPLPESIRKPLTIQGRGLVTFTLARHSGVDHPTVIQDIPAGQHFTLRYGDITHRDRLGGQPMLRIKRNAGTILLENLRFQPGSVAPPATSLAIRDCTRVICGGVRLHNIDAQRATLILNSCVLTGRPWVDAAQPGAAPLTLEDGHASLVSTGLLGTFNPRVPALAHPALRSRNSHVTVRHGCTLQAEWSPSAGNAATVGDAWSTLTLDQGTRIGTTGVNPPHRGYPAGAVRTDWLPTLVSHTSQHIGTNLNYAIHARIGDAIALFCGLPGPPQPIHAAGTLHLDPDGSGILLQQLARFETTFGATQVPNIPSLRGHYFGFQAIVARRGIAQLTNFLPITPK